MMFTAEDYTVLHELVFADGYPGYRTEVLESPNGDGKVDASKRYAHVDVKYLKDTRGETRRVLTDYLIRAYREASEVAGKLGVSEDLWPSYEYGALRVLEYPVGAGSELHTDFDLFTLLCFRNDKGSWANSPLRLDEGRTIPNSEAWRLYRISKGLHMGEIGELAGLGIATPHYVEPRQYIQQSIVYFAIPKHSAHLTYKLPEPGKVALTTVGSWITERMARSRTYK